MTETMLCITFVGIVLSFLLLFYLFLDTYVNRKTELHNNEITTAIDKLVTQRLEQLKHPAQTQSVNLSSRINILNRFIEEVKRH